MILLSIGSLRFYGLDRVFGIAKDLGFDGIEVIVDDRHDTSDPVYLNRLVERYKLPIGSLHSPFGFVSTPHWGEDPAERMRKSIRLAEAIKSDVAVFHLPFFSEKKYGRWVKEELKCCQTKTKVKLAVENMPCAYKILGTLGAHMDMGIFYEAHRGKFINRILRPFSKRCFERNNWNYLMQFEYLVLDTTHLATGGHDPIEAYEKIKSKLVLVHVSNFTELEHQPLVSGHVDIKRFLQHLKKDGYKGHITLELMPDHFPDKSEQTARKILAADLNLLRANA